MGKDLDVSIAIGMEPSILLACTTSIPIDADEMEVANRFKDGEALYNQQKQDWRLTVAQIMNSLLPNSD